MILRIQVLTLILTLSFLAASPQKLKKADKVTLANLQTHIQYLADDKLEGRRTGTAGERAAGDYISIEFAKAGLTPRGDNNGWRQAFTIDQGLQISPETLFSVNDKPLTLYKEYFPLAFSARKEVAGTPAVALQEGGEPWFLDLKDLLEAARNSTSFNLSAVLRAKAREYSKKGATALILYNSGKIPDNLAFDPIDHSDPAVLPVIYITRDTKIKYLKDESASLDIKIRVGFTDKKRGGSNILGFLDNGAASTVVIGAHYDHLGLGEDSNTRYRGADRPVFNGADDNASGVAAIIELARLLKGSALRNNNYLFIAFSGEELGAAGSEYFVSHSPVDLKKISYMVNLEMVGRLNDTTHTLSIGGYKTSPAWENICNSLQDKKYFTLRFDNSDARPGDQSAFYRKEIPVLMISTGIESDYHLPTDDPDKINYSGELQVLKYVYDLVEDTNKKGRIPFEKEALSQ